MRKYYIDFIRLFCVMLLIPFHTFMMYNSFGEGQYVYGTPLTVASWIIWFFDPWFMKLMFVIAGMSTRFSLQNRNIKQYISERLTRIGLPLLTGILLLNTFMSYIADITNNGYECGYFNHFIIFFTKWTDLSGYDGGFGLSHLWFLLYLLIISFFALPIYILLKKIPKFMVWDKYPIILIIAFGALQAQSNGWINIGGKSLTQYFFLFLIGLFVLSHEKVQEKLEKYRWWFLLSTLIFGIGCVFTINMKLSGFIFDLFYFTYGYIMILGLLGIGRKYLNIQNKKFIKVTQLSMLYYIFHYPILVGVAYILLPYISIVSIQIITIIIISYILTFITVEMIKLIPFVGILFGIKKVKE